MDAWLGEDVPSVLRKILHYPEPEKFMLHPSDFISARLLSAANPKGPQSLLGA